MNLKRNFMLGILLTGCLLNGKPVIEEIANKSDVGFLIFSHTDRSICSYSGKGKVIDAGETTSDGILLDDGDPSLVLRPIYYNDQDKNRMMLIDSNYQFDQVLIEKAYQSWLAAGGSKKRFSSCGNWLNYWVGGDIEIYPKVDHLAGYAHDKSVIQIKNRSKNDFDMLIYSVGIFAKLVLGVEIDQNSKSGISPKMRIIVGEGAVCKNGIVESL